MCQLQETLPEFSSRILVERNLPKGPGSLPLTSSFSLPSFFPSFLPSFLRSFLPSTPLPSYVSPASSFPGLSHLLASPPRQGYQIRAQLFLTTLPRMGPPASTCSPSLGLRWHSPQEPQPQPFPRGFRKSPDCPFYCRQVPLTLQPLFDSLHPHLNPESTSILSSFTPMDLPKPLGITDPTSSSITHLLFLFSCLEIFPLTSAAYPSMTTTFPN